MYQARGKAYVTVAALTAGMCAITLSACAPVIIGGAAVASGQRVAQERSLGDGFDDAGIDLQIKRALFETKGYDFSDIDITVYEARVLLTGTTPDETARQTAGKLAWKGKNVAEVINEIVIAEETKVLEGGNDAWIETRLRSRMTGDRAVVGINYEIVVSQGVVYLLGVSQNQAERDRVVNHARVVAGVRRVVSHIQLKDDPARRLR